MIHRNLLSTAVLGFCLTLGIQAVPLTSHPVRDVYQGWHLGTQAYSFNRYTFYEAVDKTADLGLSWIEAYPGQSLSKEHPDVKFDYNMSPELRKAVKQKLAESGVRLLSYGVVPMPNDEAECRKVFDFAKDMGIQNIVCEPPEDAFDMLDRLCQEYQIAIAIHNHPKPSHYWNPDTVLKVCKGRSHWIGACADTGHWMRSGINPIDAIKKLHGRINSLHFKDLNQYGPEGHDVPWGTGQANVKEILSLLHEQGFVGGFSIEYEYHWENSVPEIREAVKYFDQVAATLNPSGWHNLLADDLSNCTFKPGSWDYKDGVLTRVGGGDIWTRDKHGDFLLDLEFKVDPGSNSGVFIRTGDLQDWINTAMEVQIHETGDGTPHGQCGAIYDCLSPSKDVTKKAGEWNHMTIEAEGPMIYVVLNGEQIISMDLDKWTEPHKNPDGTPNKFKYAYKDMARAGFFGFQDHHSPVWFRNVKIRDLSKAE